MMFGLAIAARGERLPSGRLPPGVLGGSTSELGDPAPVAPFHCRAELPVTGQLCGVYWVEYQLGRAGRVAAAPPAGG
jgi:hypothetical protein